MLPHLQARLSDTVHVRRKALLVAEIAAVPDAPDRFEAQARLKSQSGKGAMMYVQAPPCTDPGRTMQNDVFRKALRRGCGHWQSWWQMRGCSMLGGHDSRSLPQLQ